MSSFYFSLAISRIETLRDDEREKNIYRKAPSAFLTAEKLAKDRRPMAPQKADKSGKFTNSLPAQTCKFPFPIWRFL